MSAEVLLQILDILTGEVSRSPPAIAQSTSPASLWINILWFLSLVLSLASALFGMISKQWLREYISWTSSSSSARELSRLRQARRVAWREWHVPGIINGIAASLEVALVLFFCGLVILLWTLNYIVASILSVAIFTFIVAGFTVIILPTFSRNCPYRSPLAWGSLLFWNRLGQIPGLLNPLIVRFGGRPLPMATNIPVVGEWLTRDINLALPRDSSSAHEWFSAVVRTHYPSDNFTQETSDSKETEMLLRCLIWVGSSTRHQQLLEEVYNCTAMVHTIQSGYPSRRLQPGLRAVCRICHVDDSHLAAYSNIVFFRTKLEAQATPIFVLKTARARAVDNQDCVDKMQQAVAGLSGTTLEILSHFLYNDIVSFLGEMAESIRKPTVRGRCSLLDPAFKSQLDTLMVAFSFFICSFRTRRPWNRPSYSAEGFPSLAYKALCNALCRVTDDLAVDFDFSDRFPGMKATLLDVLGELATVKVYNVIYGLKGM